MHKDSRLYQKKSGERGGDASAMEGRRRKKKYAQNATKDQLNNQRRRIISGVTQGGSGVEDEPLPGRGNSFRVFSGELKES